jgi:hypothetical protein
MLAYPLAEVTVQPPGAPKDSGHLEEAVHHSPALQAAGTPVTRPRQSSRATCAKAKTA